MNLENAFIGAIVRAGLPLVMRAKALGIGPGDIDDNDAREALTFLYDYVQKYRDVPSPELLTAKLGVDLDPTPGSADFLVDEMMSRRLFRRLKTGIDESIQLLDKQQPRECFQNLEAVLRQVRKDNLASTPIERLFALGDLVLEQYEEIKAGKKGILTRWPSINDSTLGFWPQELILFVARVATGKCLVENSEIIDPVTGVPRSIAQVYYESRCKTVLTWSPEKGIHPWPITAKVDTGYKKCFRVLLKSGRFIEVTPEHPFLTPGGWMRAELLKPGDSVALPAKIPAPLEPRPMATAEAVLLAILLAEGTYTGHHIGFSTGDAAFLEIAKDCASEMGLRVQAIPGTNCDFDFVIADGTRENKARSLLKRLGIDNTKAKDKYIPDDVYQLPNEQLAHFIGTFWMGDGSIEKTGPYITLASRRMVYQLQHLLLRFGIQSSVRYKAAKLNGEVFDSWRLRVYAGSYARMLDSITLWGEKRERLIKLCSKARIPQSGNPVLPADLVSKLEDIFKSSAKPINSIGVKHGWTSNFSFRNLFVKNRGTRISLRFLQDFADLYGCEKSLEWLWKSDIFWDDVVSTTPVGEKKIYDLTVRPTSCFVANDIIVHNTWSSIIIAHDAWEGRWFEFEGLRLIEKHRRQCIEPRKAGSEDPKCVWSGGLKPDQVTCPICNGATERKGHRILYVTTEISKLRIAGRFYAVRYQLPYKAFRSGKLASVQEERLRSGVRELAEAPGMYIVGGDFDFTIGGLEAAIEEAQPDMLVLDGAYLMKGDGRNRSEQAANTFDDIKRLLHRYKIAGVVTSQLNRQANPNQKNTVNTESIALTDVAGWNSDMVIGMVQPDNFRVEQRMCFKPLKVREGEGQEIELRWDFQTMVFDELPRATTNQGTAQPSGDASEAGAVEDAVPF